LKKSKSKPAVSRAPARISTWQFAAAVLLVLTAAADAAYLLHAEWAHFGNPDMGSMAIAAGVLGAALCGTYSLFTRQPGEQLAMASLALVCVAAAHGVLLSGRLNYRAPCEAGQYECARTGLNRTMVAYHR
jgi:hypothetical protein